MSLIRRPAQSHLFCLLSKPHTCSPAVGLAWHVHLVARRGLGPRQYAPKGYREAAGRAPMTYEFGEECNGLARAAHQTKNYGDAIALYDRTLAMRRERHGPIHCQCAATLHNIGRVFLDMKEYGAAENALTEAAAIYEKLEGGRSLRYAESLGLLALAYTHLQFLDEAEKAFRESIRIFRDVCYNHVRNSWLPEEAFGADGSCSDAHEGAQTALPQVSSHPNTESGRAGQHTSPLSSSDKRCTSEGTLEHDGTSRHTQQPISSHTTPSPSSQTRSSAAHAPSSAQDESLSLLLARHPNKHPLASAAHALADCAALFLLRRQEHQAIAFLEESLTIRRFLYRRHEAYRPMIAQTLNKLCELRRGINDAVGAEMAIEECLTICRQTLGAHHPATAQAISSKAGLLAARRQLRQARTLYVESSRLYAATLGEDAGRYGCELIKLGRIEELTDDYDTAESTLRKGVAVIESSFGKESAEMAEAQTFLGSLLVRKWKLSEAVEALRWAVRICKARNGADPQLAFLYQKLGDAYALRREAHAEAYFLLSIEAFRANAAVERSQKSFLSDVLDDLALFYVDFQHYEKAESCLKEALAIRIELLGEHHATVAYSYSNFSLLYLQRREYAACEAMAHRALDMYAKTAKSNVLAQADVYTTLGQCLSLQHTTQSRLGAPGASNHSAPGASDPSSTSSATNTHSAQNVACVTHEPTRLHEAIQWHEKALNIRRTRGEGSALAVAESLNHVARVRCALREYAAAHRLLHEARRIIHAFSSEITAALRAEMCKTEELMPPMDQWKSATATSSASV